LLQRAADLGGVYDALFRLAFGQPMHGSLAVVAFPTLLFSASSYAIAVSFSAIARVFVFFPRRREA